MTAPAIHSAPAAERVRRTDWRQRLSDPYWRIRRLSDRPSLLPLLPWVLATLCFADFAALGVRDQARMVTSGYDLGIFDEAVRDYAHGHAPVTPLKGFGVNLLGDHFSPILALLAPFYRIWPSADTLLIAQAVLLALAAVPLTRWAIREIGGWAGTIIGFCYCASWGVASAAGFDVHEVAFGVPLIAFSATALGERRLRAAALWALPLLLVKEDMGFTVAVVGILITMRGRRGLGLATAVAGVAGSVLEIWVLIPMAGHHGYTYLSSVIPSGASTPSALGAGGSHSISHAVLHTVTGLSNPVKLRTLLLLLAPTAFLAVRSPLILLAVPTLVWRFVSGNPAYWGTEFHYSAVLMPITSAAFIEALIQWRRTGHRYRRAHTWLALGIALAVTILLVPSRPPFSVLRASTWSTSPHVAAAHRLLDEIPDGATVAATNNLVPQLTDRDTVTLLGNQLSLLERNTWIIADTKSPPFPGTVIQRDQWLVAAQRDDGFRLVAEQDGIVLLERVP